MHIESATAKKIAPSDSSRGSFGARVPLLLRRDGAREIAAEGSRAIYY